MRVPFNFALSLRNKKILLLQLKQAAFHRRGEIGANLICFVIKKYRIYAELHTSGESFALEVN